MYTMECHGAVKRRKSYFQRQDGPGNYHAKWNKPARERQIPYGFTDVWNLMNKINE